MPRHHIESNVVNMDGYLYNRGRLPWRKQVELYQVGIDLGRDAKIIKFPILRTYSEFQMDPSMVRSEVASKDIQEVIVSRNFDRPYDDPKMLDSINRARLIPDD